MDRHISSYLVQRLLKRYERLFYLKFIEEGHEFDQMYTQYLKAKGKVFTNEELRKL